MKTPKLNKNDTFVVFGEYFGFPKCCIQEFYKMEHIGQQRKLFGTGYVPCLKCNEKTEEELISVITTNRKCKTPFPEEDTETVREMVKMFY